MKNLMLRLKSHRHYLGAALGLAILGAGTALTATPAKADTWYYDGAGHRVIVRERPVYAAPPAYYYAPGPYYYGRDYYYPPVAGVAVGVPGFGLRLGF